MKISLTILQLVAAEKHTHIFILCFSKMPSSTPRYEIFQWTPSKLKKTQVKCPFLDVFIMANLEKHQIFVFITFLL